MCHKGLLHGGWVRKMVKGYWGREGNISRVQKGNETDRRGEIKKKEKIR